MTNAFILWVVDPAGSSTIPGLTIENEGHADGLGLADDDGNPVPVADAAAALGVTTEALRAEANRHGIDLADDGAGTEATA